MKWSYVVLILTVFVDGLWGDSLPIDDEDEPDDLQSSGSGQGEVPDWTGRKGNNMAQDENGDIHWPFYFMICSGIAAGIIIVVAIVVLIHRLRRTQDSRKQKIPENQKSSKEHV